MRASAIAGSRILHPQASTGRGAARPSVKIELSDLFGAALDAAGTCVGIVDATGALVLCNRAMSSALLDGGAERQGGELLPLPSWEQHMGAASITSQEFLEGGRPTGYRIVVCDPPERGRQPETIPPRLKELLQLVQVILTQSESGSLQSRSTAQGRAARPPSLSGREWDIVQGLMTYRRLSEVAGAMSISVHTARTHLKSVFRKMQVRSQSELLQLLLRTGEPRHS